MRKKQEIQDIKQAVQLSVEFTAVDPIKEEMALAYAEKSATERKTRNEERLARIERENAPFRTVAARLTKAQIKALREYGAKFDLKKAELEAQRIVARMERKVARMEAEVLLQQQREEESQMRKRMVIINGKFVVIPKPNEVAHLIQEPILNFR